MIHGIAVESMKVLRRISLGERMGGGSRPRIPRQGRILEGFGFSSHALRSRAAPETGRPCARRGGATLKAQAGPPNRTSGLSYVLPVPLPRRADGAVSGEKSGCAAAC